MERLKKKKKNTRSRHISIQMRCRYSAGLIFKYLNMTEENVIKVQTEGLSSIRVQVCADVLSLTIADHSQEGKSVSVTLSRKQVNDLAISLLILKKRLQSGVSN